MVKIAAPDGVPFPVLIGDIGGTNARFALVPERDAPLQVFPSDGNRAVPANRGRHREPRAGENVAPAESGDYRYRRTDKRRRGSR